MKSLVLCELADVLRNIIYAKEGTEMDVIIRKYRLHMEENVLVLTHPAGISFDLTLDEAIGLMEAIKVYKDAKSLAQRDTEPQFKRAVVDEESITTEYDAVVPFTDAIVP